jgi:ABC-type sugar transport system permease subunit
MSLKSKISEVFKIDELKDNFLELIEAKFELKKLELLEKIESAFTDLAYTLALAFMGLMVAILFVILLAVGINILLDSQWYGFAIVFALFLIPLLILIGKKEPIKKQILAKIQEEVDKKMNS